MLGKNLRGFFVSWVSRLKDIFAETKLLRFGRLFDDLFGFIRTYVRCILFKKLNKRLFQGICRGVPEAEYCIERAHSTQSVLLLMRSFRQKKLFGR